MDRKNKILMKSSGLIILLCCCIISSAQRPAKSIWLNAQMPVVLSTHWQWHNDASYRTINFTYSSYQYVISTGIRYLIDKNWNISAGASLFYTRTTADKSSDEFGNEYRAWQELNFKTGLNKNSSLHQRFRTEERWFDAVSYKARYKAFRVRYRVLWDQSLNKRWGMQLSDEYMVQSVSNSFSFNQNRLFLLAVYKFNSSVRVQSGYMWVIKSGSTQYNLILTFQKSFSMYGKCKKRNS
jgi:hypothetical protein